MNPEQNIEAQTTGSVFLEKGLPIYVQPVGLGVILGIIATLPIICGWVSESCPTAWFNVLTIAIIASILLFFKYFLSYRPQVEKKRVSPLTLVKVFAPLGILCAAVIGISLKDGNVAAAFMLSAVLIALLPRSLRASGNTVHDLPFSRFIYSVARLGATLMVAGGLYLVFVVFMFFGTMINACGSGGVLVKR